LSFCEDNGVDYVFVPTVEEIYARGKDNIVTVKPPLSMSDCLCGASRKGHFEGVLTVVLKLFNLVEPTQAFFGEKDYQQLSLIRAMKEDLNFNIEIIGVPTIREESGLAMSSRNRYLSLDEKTKALELFEALQAAKKLINEGQNAHQVLTSLKKDYFEYFEARDPLTLQATEVHPMRLFIAAKIGDTRLIDNLEV
jgi:pantoate--beta-alanine ligase